MLSEEESDENYTEHIDSSVPPEVEEDRKLNAIIKFKDYIVKEPEFCGIKNISAYQILTILEDEKVVIPDGIELTKYQEELFYDLFIELYGNAENVDHYHCFVRAIFQIVYV